MSNSQRTLSMAVAASLLIAGRALAQDALDHGDHASGHQEHAHHGSEQHEHAHHGAEHASHDDQPPADSSEARHVPPDPPQHLLPDHSYDEMAEMMQMDDRERYGRVVLDQVEWRDERGEDVLAWDADAIYGGDYQKLRFRTEGKAADAGEDVRAEALWDRIISPWWNVQAGVRRDFGDGPSRTWAAFGIEGLAPYWFDVEAAFYIGEQGRTELRVDFDYDLLLTQRLILQPHLEADVYGKSDRERRIGSGLAELEAGLRLRYELRRELAPYVGVLWTRLFGTTADLARADGEETDDLALLAGLRVWF